MSTRILATLFGLAVLFTVVEFARTPDGAEFDEAAVEARVDERLGEVLTGLLRAQSEQASLTR
jgi:hypothetical protein